MKTRSIVALAALALSSGMALAQAVVPGYEKPVSQEDPSLASGGSRNAPAGVKSKPATVAQPDAMKRSGTLGAPNIERREN